MFEGGRCVVRIAYAPCSLSGLCPVAIECRCRQAASRSDTDVSQSLCWSRQMSTRHCIRFVALDPFHPADRFTDVNVYFGISSASWPLIVTRSGRCGRPISREAG